jgi:hypothetical protein
MQTVGLSEVKVTLILALLVPGLAVFHLKWWFLLHCLLFSLNCMTYV